MREKVLLLFSGGFDSSVLFYDYVNRGFDVHTLFIDYGQKPLEAELACANYTTGILPEENRHIITMNPIRWSQSEMIAGKEKSAGEENDYIEMRNLIFLSYATSLAESLGIDKIGAAFIKGANDYFPDASPVFAKLFSTLTELSCGIELETPYVTLNKEELVQYCRDIVGYTPLKLVFEHSISCNFGSSKPCGTCSGCTEIEHLRNKYLK